MTGDAMPPKPKRVQLSTLGQNAFKQNGRGKPLTRAEREQIARQARHTTLRRPREACGGGGLREPICILKGQDRDAVIAAAQALAELADR